MSEDVSSGPPSTWIFATVKASWGPIVVAKIAFSQEMKRFIAPLCSWFAPSSQAATSSMLHQVAEEQSEFIVSYVVLLSTVITKMYIRNYDWQLSRDEVRFASVVRESQLQASDSQAELGNQRGAHML
jgi:hypothetical protein